MIENKLKVAVNQTPPCVMESSGKYTGFEIELWEAVAKEIRVSFEYEKHTFQELIPLIVGKKADIAFGAITIKETREESIDFSHPIFHSGLRILLSKNRSKIDLIGTMRAFAVQGCKQLTRPIILLVVLIAVFGNGIWLVEKSGGAIASAYFPGVFQAIWISMSMIIGSAGGLIDVYGVTSWAGRLILTLGQFINLAILGLLIGEVTAFITTRKIRLNIEEPGDLKGKIVATVQGTTSEQILKSLGATVVPVIAIEEAYEKLRKNKVEAVVFDAPVITYYALNAGAMWAEVAGEVFDKQDYGIACQEKSLLREEINRGILTIKESGLYEVLHRKYFREAE